MRYRPQHEPGDDHAPCPQSIPRSQELLALHFPGSAFITSICTPNPRVRPFFWSGAVAARPARAGTSPERLGPARRERACPGVPLRNRPEPGHTLSSAVPNVRNTPGPAEHRVLAACSADSGPRVPNGSRPSRPPVQRPHMLPSRANAGAEATPGGLDGRNA